RRRAHPHPAAAVALRRHLVSRQLMADLATIFERSPELTTRLVPRVRPEDGPEEIIEKARVILEGFAEPALIATLDAHPPICASTCSPLSRAEQGTEDDPRVQADLDQLNLAYERKFGFRFVVFVNGRRRSEIVPILRERLERSRRAELRTGIDEFLAISLERLRRHAAPT